MPDLNPPNLTINTGNAGAAFTQGLQSGVAASQIPLQVQQQQQQLQQQQATMARAQQMRADLAGLANNPNPTAADYNRIVLQYPEIKDSIKSSWDALSTERQQAKLQQATPIYSAVRAGRMDIATDLLQQQVDALKNSKAPAQEIQAAQTWLTMAQQAPDVFAHNGGLYLSSVMGPEAFEKAYGTVSTTEQKQAALPGQMALTGADAEQKRADAEKARAEAAALPQKTAAEIANSNSQIWERGARLGLDQDKLATESGIKLQELQQKYGQIPGDARKNVNDFTNAAIVSRNSASQMRGLADQFEKADPASFTGGTRELLKNLTGQQNYITSLRQEFTRIKNSQMLAFLPPGSASDKDVAMAKGGFLSDTAKPAEIVGWLRSMGNLQDYQAKFDTARADWIAANQHLGPLARDVDIDGTKVAAGTSFTDFMRAKFKDTGAQTQPPGATGDYMSKYGK